MHKLKYILFLFVLIIISFLIAALTPPPETNQYNFDLSTNIPDNHKIKIINYGNGSLFVNDAPKHNGDIIICSRFSTLDVTVVPNSSYEVDKIFFNNDDITSSLNSNIITIHSITKDGTLEFKFKASQKSSKSSLKDKVLQTKNFITDRFIETKSFLTNKAIEAVDSLSSVMKTGDVGILSICTIFILIISPLIYIIYYIKRR